MIRQRIALFGSALLCGLLPLASATVFAAENFSVDLRSSKQTVEPGQIVTFTVTLRNNDSRTATGASASLTLHKELEFKSASDDGDERNDSVEWKDLTVPGGGSLSLNVSAAVSDDVTDDQDLFISAFAGGNAAEVVVTVDDEDVNDNDNDRNIRSSLSASAQNIEAGEVFSYTVTVENMGDRKINDFSIDLELDDKLEFLSASNGGSESSQTVTWEGLDIEKGQTRKLTASVRADEELRDNDAIESTISAEGSADTLRLTATDNDRGQEKVSVFAFTQDDEVELGGEITYVIHLRNQDNDDQVVKMLAHIDRRTKFVSASDSGLQLERYMIEWKEIKLDQNETKTMELVLQNDSEKGGHGSVLETIFVAGTGNRHVRNRVVDPDFNGTVTQNSSGDETTPSTSSFVIDPQGIIAASQKNQAPSGPSSTTEEPEQEEAEPRDVVSEKNDEVADETDADSGGFLSRFIGRNSDESEEQEALSAQVAQSEQSDETLPPVLSVSQTTDKTEVRPGSVVTYTVTARNEGDRTANNLLLTQTLPERSIEIESVPGGTVKDNVITWNIPRILARDRWQTTFTARIADEVNHGTQLESTLELTQNDEPSTDSIASLNVIDRLPSAGIGAFSIATINSANALRSSSRKAHAALPSISPETPSVNESPSDEGGNALFLLGILLTAMTFASLGAVLSAKLLRLR